MSYLQLIKHTHTRTHANKLRDASVYPNEISALFNKSETIAALACAEAFKLNELNTEWLDSLLTQALFKILHTDGRFADKIKTIEYTTKHILPSAKETLSNLYTCNEFSIAEFDEIIHATHQECDYEFLQFVTNIYASAYIKHLTVIETNRIN